MKSKAIDFTEEYRDLIKVIDLSWFLIKLKVPGATELSSDASEIHSNTFCDECENYKDDCDCNSSYRAEYDDGADYEDS
jgi:hypothetical protein